ncbi:MAG: UvrD-helicase domain-containing protein [Clostridia bacterium]|nr:UvrD-helicase domain-containing protein [Clostridia bacterium]
MIDTNKYLTLRDNIIKKDFSRMNDMQFSAVTTVDGPLLVLAGAGSGKTTVLVNRIACLMKYGAAFGSDIVPYGVTEEHIAAGEAYLAGSSDILPQGAFSVKAPKPWEILAITFTNKAAGELKDRIINMLGEEGNDIWAGTFHSVCGKMLRRDADRIGYDRHFSIYDTDDSKRVMKECLKEIGVEEKHLPVKSVLSAISSAKDSLISPEEYEKSVGNDFRMKKIAEAYRLYQKKLFDADAMDFDDMIYNTVRLLSENDDIKEYYNAKFKYIMVDEYQDTNHAQYVLVKLLAQGYENLCVVGDDDQSIYRFRGATIENILSFEDGYENAKVIRLEQNYRSTGNILDAANAVIANNKGRKGKTLWTAAGNGEKIEVYTAEDDRGEARYVSDTVLDFVSAGGRFAQNAVLYRMNAQSRSVENAFVRSGVPYRVIGGTRFYERKEIKDVISYLSVINNQNDTLRLTRIINEPARGIGATLLSRASDIAASENIPLFDVLKRANEYGELSRSAGRMMEFTSMISALCEIKDTVSLHELCEKLLEESGYMIYLKNQGEEGADRAENVKELLNGIYQYEQENDIVTLSSYLEDVALFSDIDNYDTESDSVVLMTLHSAKGLEFDNVFLIGLEEGIFPGNQSMFGSEEDIEEERRLAYVGITRARKKLHITNAYQRMLYGSTNRNQQSRFLREVPMELCNVRKAQTINSFWSERSFGGGFSSYKQDNDFSFSSFTAPKKPTPAPQPKPAAPSLECSVGMRVRHKTFGEGMVLSITPMGNDTLIEVAFDTVGTKKLMSNFAKLTKVE